MKRRVIGAAWILTIVIAYFAGYAYGPAGSAAAGQQTAAGAQQPAGAGRGQPQLAGALPPGEHSKISLSPDQGEPFLFAGADLRKYHTDLQARVKKTGANVQVPTDLIKRTLTRTHSYTMVHRGGSSSTEPVNPEQHEGVTDVYFVVGGSGTVVVGGQIPNRRTVRPGEYAGEPITGGRAFKLAAGDIFNIPPNTPHATMADAGGMTYVLMKINVGLYPWSLVNGTP